jgi:DNA sulfur modification protein DndE
VCFVIGKPAGTLITAEVLSQVFGGEAQELYLALLKERCERDGLGTSDDVLLREFRLHLHRGISYLATPHAIRSIADLVRLSLEDGDPAVSAPPEDGTA